MSREFSSGCKHGLDLCFSLVGFPEFYITHRKIIVLRLDQFIGKDFQEFPKLFFFTTDTGDSNYPVLFLNSLSMNSHKILMTFYV